MCNDKHRGRVAVHELLSQLGLDEVIGLKIDIRCGFIQHEYLSSQEHGSSETDQLFLTNREQTCTFSHQCLQTILHFLHSLVKLNFFENLPDFLISLGLEWVEIFPDSALEQKGLLRNKGDALSEQVQANLCDVNPIDLHLPLKDFCQSEQDLQDGTLSRASAAYDTNFHARLDLESQFGD